MLDLVLYTSLAFDIWLGINVLYIADLLDYRGCTSHQSQFNSLITYAKACPWSIRLFTVKRQFPPLWLTHWGLANCYVNEKKYRAIKWMKIKRRFKRKPLKAEKTKCMFHFKPHYHLYLVGCSIFRPYFWSSKMNSDILYHCLRERQQKRPTSTTNILCLFLSNHNSF